MFSPASVVCAAGAVLSLGFTVTRKAGIVTGDGAAGEGGVVKEGVRGGAERQRPGQQRLGALRKDILYLSNKQNNK